MTSPPEKVVLCTIFYVWAHYPHNDVVSVWRLSRSNVSSPKPLERREREMAVAALLPT